MVAMVTRYFVSRCILFPVAIEWMTLLRVCTYFFLSEIEYSATIDRGGMIHG